MLITLLVSPAQTYYRYSTSKSTPLTSPAAKATYAWTASNLFRTGMAPTPRAAGTWMASSPLEPVLLGTSPVFSTPYQPMEPILKARMWHRSLHSSPTAHPEMYRGGSRCPTNSSTAQKLFAWARRSLIWRLSKLFLKNGEPDLGI